MATDFGQLHGACKSFPCMDHRFAWLKLGTDDSNEMTEVQEESEGSTNSFKSGGNFRANEEDWDCLSMLTVSTPRSRLGSEQIFEDFDLLSSTLPPVGTTKPPLYPPRLMLCMESISRQPEVVGKSETSQPVDPEKPKRTFKKLVNKPIRPLHLSKERKNQ